MDKVILTSISLEELTTALIDGLKEQVENLKTPKNSEKLVTEVEASLFLKVSKVTLHKYRKLNQLKFCKVGSQVRYKISDLEEFINGMNAGSLKEAGQ